MDNLAEKVITLPKYIDTVLLLCINSTPPTA